MTGYTEVIVIGGGYAGVMAANRLTQRDDVKVTLINPRPAFVERIRLHQLVGGSDDAVVDYKEVLADGVRLVVDTVTRIDAPGRKVELATGATAGYDYLVYAVGSRSAEPSVPGAAEFAYPTGSLEEAQRLRSVVDAAPATASVTVVGGGPLGIETAAELAELGGTVTLICGGQLGPYLHPRGRRSVRKGLSKLGVNVLDGPHSKVTAVTRDAVHLADGRELPSTVTIWTAGFGAPDLAARSGLSTDAVGRLRTDETLTSVDDDRIVATGDAAAPSDAPLRMSCQAALPLGSHAADTVLSRIAGERPADFGKGIAAMCISLGRQAGVFQFAHRNDVAMRLHLNGRLGAKLKEAACRSPLKQLAEEADKPGSHSWLINDGSRRKRLQANRGAPQTTTR
ncbi:NAD(P)/FAD-dependent oxidoreductase [Kribbella swartbergensis]